MKPFFSKQTGQLFVDGRCTCGHLESEHGSQVIPLDNGQLLRLENHGNCCQGKCKCKRFTWTDFVTEEEKYAVLEEAISL